MKTEKITFDEFKEKFKTEIKEWHDYLGYSDIAFNSFDDFVKENNHDITFLNEINYKVDLEKRLIILEQE